MPNILHKILHGAKTVGMVILGGLALLVEAIGRRQDTGMGRRGRQSMDVPELHKLRRQRKLLLVLRQRKRISNISTRPPQAMPAAVF